MTATASPLRLALTPLRWPLTRLRGWVREAAWQIMHDTADHRGIPLRLHFKAPKNAATAIAQALDRIAAVDPVSFAHLPNALPGGIIADATNYATAWYSIRRKACVIGASALAKNQTDDLALCIIHEMCHARLWERGIGYDGKNLRAQVERVCIRREQAFARKLEALDVAPGTYTGWLTEKLSLVAERSYSEASFHRRYRRELLQRLRLMRDMRAPRWLRRWTILRTRARLRASRMASSGYVSPQERGVDTARLQA